MVSQDDTVELVEPRVDLKDSYLAMLGDYRHSDAPRHQDHLLEAKVDFPSLIRRLRNPRLTSDGYTEVEYWLVRHGRDVVGTIRVRPDLDKQRQRSLGHIGYDVAPSHRGRGYATLMLTLLLRRLPSMGLKRVMLVCRKGSASARVILRNGGRLDSEFTSSRDGRVRQRYWIDIPPADPAWGRVIPGIDA